MQREQWRSQFGFLLAAVGSAVGLGNIWRFSYMAYQYGGGAFLLPYIVALLSAGIPLLILEYATGHERIGSAPLAFHKIRPRWEWLGWWAVIFVMFGIELYYSVIISWSLNYVQLSFGLQWGEDPKHYFFNTFLQWEKSPWVVGGIRMPVFLGLAVIWFLNWLVVFRGVQKGLEIANKILMPTLLLVTVVMVIWAVNLPGAGQGLIKYVTPDFNRIMKADVWLAAYSQVFFTLSLGFGIMIAYASYLPDKANISGTALATALINSGYSMLAGVAVFSVLGFMSAAEGVPIDKVASDGIGLAFVVYPKALSLMPGGQYFGILFFLCLVVAGLSSSISIIEAFVSAIVDKFGINRQWLVTLICILGFAGSIIFTTKSGLTYIDIVDHYLTHYGLVLVGFFECIVVGWFFRLPTMRSHLNTISSIKLGYWWELLIQCVVPAVLLVIVVTDLIAELAKPYGGYGWQAVLAIGWNWLLMTLIAAFIISMLGWRTERHLQNGRTDI